MYVHVGLESVGHEDIEQNLNTAPAVSRNRGYRWTPSNPPSQTHCPGVRVCVYVEGFADPYSDRSRHAVLAFRAFPVDFCACLVDRFRTAVAVLGLL